METNYRSELECLICLDLMIEPVTTVCGHTFCKICLIRNLKTKLNCPMCRDPILQNGENMKKNVVMENLIKSKYSNEYNDKLKSRKIAYESEISNDPSGENSTFTFPSVIIKDAFIWPGQIKNFTLTNSVFLNTIQITSVNDRNLVLIPYEESANKICCMCELQNLRADTENNTLNFDLMGKMRFKVITFQSLRIQEQNPNSSFIYVSSGEIVKDKEVSNEDDKNEIIAKIKEIEFINNEIQANSPSSIIRNLSRKFGTEPKLNLNTIQSNSSDANSKIFENITIYYLNIIKSNEKESLYRTINVLERIRWIHEKFTNAVNFLDNQSLSLEFYDLSIPGKPKDQLLYMILMILSFIILGIAYKLKWIHFN